VNFRGTAQGSLEWDEKTGKGLTCSFSDPSPWKKAAPGQTVKVRGKADPFGLQGCDIVEVTGDPPPSFTADTLLSEPGVETKFYGKYVALTGEIAAVNIEKKGSPEITLKTKQPEPEVVCSLSIASDDRKKELKVGQKVKVYGKTVHKLKEGKRFWVENCVYYVVE
jgi:hypothetical protein